MLPPCIYSQWGLAPCKYGMYALKHPNLVEFRILKSQANFKNRGGIGATILNITVRDFPTIQTLHTPSSMLRLPNVGAVYNIELGERG